MAIPRSSAGMINPARSVRRSLGTTSAGRKLAGMDKVIQRLQVELTKIKSGAAQGMVEAVAFIHADTETTPPLTPVDTGNLRSSWRTVFFRKNKQSVIRFGYSANYALYVHEMLGALREGGGKAINWSRPNSGAKWFQYAIQRNIKRITHIIFKNAKIKG